MKLRKCFSLRRCGEILSSRDRTVMELFLQIATLIDMVIWAIRKASEAHWRAVQRIETLHLARSFDPFSE